MSGKPQPAPLVDWPLLLALLRKHAGPLARLARLARLDERTINRLARGDVAQPRFDQGVLLLDLARDHLPADDWHRVRAGSPLAAAPKKIGDRR